jgi:hypothetical protein
MSQSSIYMEDEEWEVGWCVQISVLDLILKSEALHT